MNEGAEGAGGKAPPRRCAIMFPFGLFRRKARAPSLDRKKSLSATAVISPLVRMERDDAGHIVLHLPRRRTSMVRTVAKAFKLPPEKRIELDELGSYTVELCDGSHTVAEIIRLFAEKFRLGRREAEVSMISYLQMLAGRGIISLLVPKDK